MARRTKDIRHSTRSRACDVCGRTLLRGEHAEVYVNGSTRRRSASCASRARCTRGGCARATVAGVRRAASSGSERRRLAARPPAPAARARRAPRQLEPAATAERRGPAPVPRRPPRRSRASGSRRRCVAGARGAAEPRHVRAVPTSGRAARSRRRSTCSTPPSTAARSPASRGRSGPPDVSVHARSAASEPRQRRRLVGAVLVPLRGRPLRRGPERPGRDQGYELDELSAPRAPANASHDEHGAARRCRSRSCDARKAATTPGRRPARRWTPATKFDVPRDISISGVIYCVVPEAARRRAVRQARRATTPTTPT